MPLHVPTLAVDLAALRANYRLLKDRHTAHAAAAVVKANAYGLGIEEVARALWNEKCRTFFVATLAEGIALRKILPDARIGVFNGVMAKEEKNYIKQRLTPVLNDVGQIERWAKIANPSFPAILHVDTGMTRLGLTASDLTQATKRYPEFLKNGLAYVMSHLACANDKKHAKNAEQLKRFQSALKLLPGVKASLCNSSGLFLPKGFHFDLPRPGCALYGINPTDGKNPMAPVATLSAPFLQVRTLDRNEAVGYGATFKANQNSRIAIVGFGYADGWFRSLSNKCHAYIAGVKVPVVGRISMDMMALDVSTIPEAKLKAGARAEFINTQQTVDDIAKAAGTIGYEVFTRIGRRVERRYS